MFVARFNKKLGNIQAEERKFVSYKNMYILVYKYELALKLNW